MEQPNIQRKKDILFVGHLQEIDDLRSYGRDAPLLETEKNKQDLKKIVDAIELKIRETNKKAVLFVTSPRIRAKETARLVSLKLREKLGDGFKFRYSTDENMKSTEQGEFILPENYEAGSFFEGLSIASKIFIQESLEQKNKNLNYRFGDPVIEPDGSFKYAELAKYFKASGETYAESLIRIFNSIIEMSKKINKLDKNTEVVLVSHGFNFHILRGLTIIGEKIKKDEVNLNHGDFVFKIWEIYKNNTEDFKSLAYVPLDITDLGNEELILFLSKEVEFLKNT